MRMVRNFANSSIEQGQVLLIVVLVMVVALTVVLSVATRTITNVRTTTEEENSQRAFSAAEAGIERALQAQSSLSNVNLENNATIKNVVFAKLDDDALVLNNDTPVSLNSGQDIWFARKTDGTLDIANGVWPTSGTGTLRIYWGDNGSDLCGDGALEVIFLSNAAPNGALVTTHQLIDRCASRSNNANLGLVGSVAQATGTVGGRAFGNVVTFTGLSRIIHVRVIPLYEETRIGVDATNLPPQGEKITSIGESGETFRKIEVTRPYPGIPAELFSVLFSPAGN